MESLARRGSKYPEVALENPGLLLQKACATRYFVQPGRGSDFEDALASLRGFSDSSSEYPFEQLRGDLPSLPTLQTWIASCPPRDARDLAYGLLETAILSHDSQDWVGLGQGVADWVATLELVSDKKLSRRLQLRLNKTLRAH